MNLTLHLNTEMEARLREISQQTGKEPEALAIEALQEKLADHNGATADISADEWLKKFREWIASMPQGNPDADFSRESIYEGRGE